MPVDYCWWNGQLVMGRDDASTTGGNIWAGQSHSAPWFGQLSDLENWGRPAGFGGVWLNDAVTASTPSEAFLVKGFQRRILHSLKEKDDGRFNKVANIIGHTMQYHPHGDASVYDTMVRMAQDFAMRSPLIDGQGNFGSIDGDPAAAYRYTECRMERLAEELLADIEKVIGKLPEGLQPNTGQLNAIIISAVAGMRRLTCGPTGPRSSSVAAPPNAGACAPNGWPRCG